SGRKCAKNSLDLIWPGLLGVEGVDQPGPGERPQPVGAPRCKPEGGGGLAQGEAGIEFELYQFRGLRVGLGQPAEGVVQFEQVRGGGGRGVGDRSEIDPVTVTATLESVLVPSAVNQDAAHGLGRGGEEVAPAVPVPRPSVPDQT